MSVLTSSIPASVTQPQVDLPQRSSWSLVAKSGRVIVGGGVLLIILLFCLATLPWTLRTDSSLYYASQTGDPRGAPTSKSGGWFGYDALGRSMLGRCLLGGTISLAVGAAAATISVILGSGTRVAKSRADRSRGSSGSGSPTDSASASRRSNS